MLSASHTPPSAALLALGLASATTAHITHAAAPPIYELGTVTVTAPLVPTAPTPNPAADQVANTVTLDALRQFNRTDVGDALNLLSGVTVATNSRNEKIVFVRGFDARQVPLFIDGIPVYVPYDGYVDFGRFTTADLSTIQIAKGFSAVTYGPNTLGGAINLVSRKPSKELEGDINVGMSDGNTRQAAVNVGSNQGLWYVQAGAAWIDSDDFQLSSAFDATVIENGGARDNSYHQDDKLSFKIGLTPNNHDEYALSYYSQRGEKGQPPSTDPAAARYWQWPYWDKESIYFISRTALGEHETLKVRLYHDAYDNAVESYTDDTYRQLKTSGRGSVGAAGKSVYNDRTLGGAIELRSTRWARHDLGVSVQVKQDEHEADDTLRQTEHFEDTLTSVGLEDNIRVTDAVTLALGGAWSELQPDTVAKASDPVPKPAAQSATDGQIGVFWAFQPTNQLYATLARKTRFPTLKDRYSLRLGTAIPNPDLSAEHAVNYELGYRGTVWRGLHLEAAAFLSDVTDLIQQVNEVAPGKYQMQNVGKVRITGIELGASLPLGQRWEVGGNVTLLDRDNRSDDTRLTGVPERKLTAYAVFRPAARWEAVFDLQYEDSRWDSQTVNLDSFTTANCKLAYQPIDAVTIEARLNNLADADYELADGYPAAGRTWLLNVRYTF